MRNSCCINNGFLRQLLHKCFNTGSHINIVPYLGGNWAYVQGGRLSYGGDIALENIMIITGLSVNFMKCNSVCLLWRNVLVMVLLWLQLSKGYTFGSNLVVWDFLNRKTICLIFKLESNNLCSENKITWPTSGNNDTGKIAYESIQPASPLG